MAAAALAKRAASTSGAALDQRHRERAVEDVAGGGRVDGVDGEGRQPRCALRLDAPRSSTSTPAAPSVQDGHVRARRGIVQRGGHSAPPNPSVSPAPRLGRAVRAASCSFGVITGDAGEQRVRQRPRRRRVEDQPRAGGDAPRRPRPRRSRSGISSCTSRTSPGSTSVSSGATSSGRSAALAPERDGDHVLASIVDQDQRDARRRVGDTARQAQIDPVRGQAVERAVADVVGARAR